MIFLTSNSGDQPGVIRIIIANPTVPSIMYAEQNDSFFDNFYSADYY